MGMAGAGCLADSRQADSSVGPAWWHMLPQKPDSDPSWAVGGCEQLKLKQNREEKGKTGPFQAGKEQNNI